MITAERPTITSHGNYKCPYCTKVWKRYDMVYIEKHMQANHLKEVIEKETESRVDKVVAENEELRRKLEVAKAPPPKLPEKKAEYYQCVLYCKNENKVIKAGMPKGVLVENVTCSGCGVKGALVITNNDPSWII